MNTKTPTNRNRKRKVALVAAALVGAASVGAYAFWTAGGSGDGTASTGTTVPLVVNQDALTDVLAPGVAAQTLSGTFDNTGDGSVKVNTVTASIDSVVDTDGDPIVGCDATDYTLSGAVMTVNATVPTGTGVGSWTGATLAFNNKAGTNQDACKNAVVNLAYVAN